MALHMAVCNGYTAMVSKLLISGADSNIRDKVHLAFNLKLIFERTFNHIFDNNLIEDSIIDFILIYIITSNI